MKYLAIILLFTSCYHIVMPDINGIYYNKDVKLSFNNGKITGITSCNKLYGNYTTFENNISISIGGTKVYCKDEFDRFKLKEINEFKIINNKLILKSNCFDIILNKK